MARTSVPANPVPQTADEAAYHAQEYKREEEEVKRLDAEEAQEITRLRKEYDDKRRQHLRARDEHFSLAHAWGEANRRGRKTIKFTNGCKLEWRLPSSPRLLYDEEKLGTIARSIMRLKSWPKYLKIELRKANIKADIAELHKSSRTLRRLLRLDKTEFFRIS